MIGALVRSTEALLEQREALGDDCQLAVKQLFDLAKKLEPKTFTPLAELLVEGFTLDQIWEQIELYNVPLQRYVAKCAQNIEDDIFTRFFCL